MANRTMDRRKAGSARSQAAKAAKPKPVRPGAGKGADQASLKLEKTARGSKAETLEIEESETEALALDDAGEVEEEEEAVDQVEVEEEEEEEEEEQKPPKRRSFKKERDLVELSPRDYSISRIAPKSRIPDWAIVRFVRSSYRELRLVTWPSRRDTWNWSLVVVGVCVAVAVVLGAADLGLSRFVEWWVSLSQH
jgi:preprotein translocase SecE subunit